MRHALVLVALCWVTCISAFAQYSPEYQTCTTTAGAQNALDQCASEEAARADAELGAAYRALLEDAAHDQSASAKFRAFERAWTAYRNAYISAMYPAKDKQSVYGSTFPMESDLLWARLSSAQKVVLEEMRQKYQETMAADSGPSGGNKPQDQ